MQELARSFNVLEDLEETVSRDFRPLLIGQKIYSWAPYEPAITNSGEKNGLGQCFNKKYGSKVSLPLLSSWKILTRVTGFSVNLPVRELSSHLLSLQISNIKYHPNNHVYVDNSNFFKALQNNSAPFMLSLKIQSLNSKFNELNSFTSDLNKDYSNLSLIALQEIWQIQHPDLFTINGFKFFSSQRTKNKGGGVGFYINNEHPSKIIQDLSSFHEKNFECLTVEVIINNKKFIISNIYRSPSSNAENVNNFMEKFDSLLSKLNSLDCPYIIFLDSNINLLKLNHCNLSQNYIETIHNNGFLQLVRKATRIQGENFSLIDHICVKN